ncbi:DNA polymerase II [archaeon]|nr:DNA polymerase II [archaeon]
MVKGIIIYADWRNIDNKPVVGLFGRLENGESFLSINRHEPYFYIKKEDLNKAKKIREIEHKTKYGNTGLRNFEGKEVVKVKVGLPSEVPAAREVLENENINCYESDIRFVQRFLIDKGILALVEIEGDYKNSENINRVYNEPELKGISEAVESKWRDFPLVILSLDIETDSKGRIISVAYVWNEKSILKKEVLLCAKLKKEWAISCKTECELLEKFCMRLKEIDPDFILGWSLIDFDLSVLNQRMKANMLKFLLGRMNDECSIKLSKSFFRESKADMKGRVAVDGISLLRRAFIKLDDYKLETAARTLLKDGKIGICKEDFDRIIKEEPEKIAEYNLKDAELAYRIANETKTFELALQKSIITGLQIDMVGPIASLDSLYIREARKRGIVCPSRRYDSKLKKIKGGYVMESKHGLYNYIIVADFKSLYPSIIRTFNIDPYSYEGKDRKDKGLITAPNGACFRNEEGILPAILQELWEWREKARQSRNEVARYAIKILMNSFFGSLASPACRFFNLDIANAITYFGQEIVRESAEKIKEEGYKVIYMDTDSIFVCTNAKSSKEARLIGEGLCKEINGFYEEKANRGYGRESFLELQLNACFKKFLMPKLRKEEAGAKKRYAGLREDGKIIIVGLEAIRRDWTGCAREFQRELLKRVFAGKGYERYIREFVEKLKKGKLDLMLVYRKAIRKGLDEYTKTTPPHVKAARKAKEINGNLIEYLMTEEGPEPIDNVKHKIDYGHYITKQIKPIADSILCFLDTSFDEVLTGQKRLGQ